MEVIIIGGGVSGNSANLALVAADLQAQIFETEARIPAIGLGMPNAVRKLAESVRTETLS